MSNEEKDKLIEKALSSKEGKIALAKAMEGPIKIFPTYKAVGRRIMIKETILSKSIFHQLNCLPTGCCVCDINELTELRMEHLKLGTLIHFFSILAVNFDVL